jgi:uridine kinase
MGGSNAARARYEARYFPGETLYLEAVHPERLADVVVENTDPDRPRLDRRPS